MQSSRAHARTVSGTVFVVLQRAFGGLLDIVLLHGPRHENGGLSRQLLIWKTTMSLTVEL
jgi:hypothetical protein